MRLFCLTLYAGMMLAVECGPSYLSKEGFTFLTTSRKREKTQSCIYFAFNYLSGFKIEIKKKVL